MTTQIHLHMISCKKNPFAYTGTRTHDFASLCQNAGNVSLFVKGEESQKKAPKEESSWKALQAPQKVWLNVSQFIEWKKTWWWDLPWQILQPKYLFRLAVVAQVVEEWSPLPTTWVQIRWALGFFSSYPDSCAFLSRPLEEGSTLLLIFQIKCLAELLTR